MKKKLCKLLGRSRHHHSQAL